MGYDVIMSEIEKLRENISTRCEDWQLQVENVCLAIENYITELKTQGKGETINAVCNYMQQVHLSFAYALQGIYFELNRQMNAYADGMFAIESDKEKGRITQDELDALMTSLQSGESAFVSLADQVTTEVSNIKSIVTVPMPQPSPVEEQMESTYKQLGDLNEDIGTYENTHLTADFAEIETQKNNLDTLLDNYVGQTIADIKNYQVGSIYKTEEMKKIDDSRERVFKECEVEGIYLSEEDWGIDLGGCHIGQITYLDEDGIEHVNLKEAEKSLIKPANEITEAEYKALANAFYLMHDEDNMEKFLYHFFVLIPSEMTIPTKEMLHQSVYSLPTEIWLVDTDKMEAFRTALEKREQELLREAIEAYQSRSSNYSEIDKQHSELVKKEGLVRALEFQGMMEYKDWKSEIPFELNINTIENGEVEYEVKFQQCVYDLNGGTMIESSFVVGETTREQPDEALKTAKNNLKSRYGPADYLTILTGLQEGTVSKKAFNMSAVASGYGLISNVIDARLKQMEQEENWRNTESDLDGIEYGLVQGDFKTKSNIVRWNVVEQEEGSYAHNERTTYSMYNYEDVHTQGILDAMNRYITEETDGTIENLTMDMLLNDMVKSGEIREQLSADECVHYYNKIIEGIPSGRTYQQCIEQVSWMYGEDIMQ